MIKPQKNLSVLFDLDGTLLDTAKDFVDIVNTVRAELKKAPISYETLHQYLYGESDGMVEFGVEIKKTNNAFLPVKERLLALYKENSTKHTDFFPGIKTVLNYLDSNQVSWGIVTNKPEKFMGEITRHFHFDKKAKCIVAGDTLSTKKPDPAPLLYACEIANMDPAQTIYIGDAETDIIAARAAGMKSIAVTYGYHGPHTDPTRWKSDYIAEKPLDILQYLV